MENDNSPTMNGPIHCVAMSKATCTVDSQGIKRKTNAELQRTRNFMTYKTNQKSTLLTLE